MKRTPKKYLYEAEVLLFSGKRKHFPEAPRALRELDLTIKDREEAIARGRAPENAVARLEAMLAAKEIIEQAMEITYYETGQ